MSALAALRDPDSGVRRALEGLQLTAAVLSTVVLMVSMAVVLTLFVAVMLVMVWLAFSKGSPLGMEALGLPLVGPDRVRALLESTTYPTILAALALLAMRVGWGPKQSAPAVTKRLLAARRHRAAALAEIQTMTGPAPATISNPREDLP